MDLNRRLPCYKHGALPLSYSPSVDFRVENQSLALGCQNRIRGCADRQNFQQIICVIQ